MGAPPLQLAAALRGDLSLERAVETGTYLGDGAQALAEVFDSVISIELSEELHRQASASLADNSHVRLICGDSRRELVTLARDRIPTFYFLDGHWSGGNTAGKGSECPVLDEIAGIGDGHPDDCLVIDDARLFAAAPPPPHDPKEWPTLIEVFDAVREVRQSHHITMLGDFVIAVPARARPLVDEYAGQADDRGPAAGAAGRLRARASSLSSKLRR
jgi:hypothetical protein